MVNGLAEKYRLHSINISTSDKVFYGFKDSFKHIKKLT